MQQYLQNVNVDCVIFGRSNALVTVTNQSYISLNEDSGREQVNNYACWPSSTEQLPTRAEVFISHLVRNSAIQSPILYSFLLMVIYL